MDNNTTHFTGLLEDNRTEEQKAKDWDTSELYASGDVKAIFREVKDGEWKKYQTRNQDGSGSCVANTVAKMLEIKRFMGKGDSIKFSHAPIYGKRVNKPSAGMVGVDALELATKYSSCKESDLPSENLNDAQLDAIVLPSNFEDLNNLVVPTNYLTVKQFDLTFDYIAGLVEKEGCVMIWVNTDYQSWCKDIPTPGAVKKGEVRHSITAVDTIKLDGVEYIVIEDSWGKFGKYDGQRLITREFFKDAVFFAGVLKDFKYDITDDAFDPFNTVMVYGERSEEIKRLQKLLQARGFFPADQECTGYYGGVTARAVYLMQVQYNVAPISELNSIQVNFNGKLITVKGGRVGKKTLLKINAKLLTK